MKPPHTHRLLVGFALAFALMASGCGTTQTPAPVPVATEQAVSQQFWDAMKQGGAKAKAFLASDFAKKNAPLFFRVCTSLSLVGYSEAGGNVPALCTNILVPISNGLAKVTAAQVDAATIERIAREAGAHGDLSKYDPIADLLNPSLEWMLGICGPDTTLALYYIHAAAEGVNTVALRHPL